MKRNTLVRAAMPAGLALTFALTACGAPANEPSAPAPGASGADSGATATIAGIGASSQKSAMESWKANFQKANPSATVNYDPQGSGAGREQWLAGAADFAGSDSALKPEEAEKVPATCGDVVEFPAYVSPIAIAYNVEGVDNLQLSASTIAKIFAGKITKWNDPAIAAENAGVTLPATAITTVHRSDKSGTTENFTDYLSKAAKADWTEKASGDWPMKGGEAAKGTSGVVDAIKSGNGTIGYADHSQIGDLKVVKVKVGEEYIEPTSEGAAAIVDESEQEKRTSPYDFVINIKRDTTNPKAYPVTLLTYTITCSKFSDADKANTVKSFLQHVVSEEGQKAAEESAGSAPISDKTREAAMKGIDMIAAG